VVGVEARTAGDRMAAERDGDGEHQLVDGHLIDALAVGERMVGVAVRVGVRD
jgi:hypothetical protein